MCQWGRSEGGREGGRERGTEGVREESEREGFIVDGLSDSDCS